MSAGSTLGGPKATMWVKPTGAVDTPIDAPVKRDPQKMQSLLSEIPMRRMGRPEEIAQLCVYLASEDAAYVTGASLYIDGGMSKKSGSL